MAKKFTQNTLIIAVFTIIVLTIMCLIWGPRMTPETMDYFRAGEQWITGALDVRRMPLFPLLCVIGQLIFGLKGAFWVVVGANILVFILSQLWLNRMLKLIFYNVVIELFLSFAYLFITCYWVIMVAPTSICTSLVIVLVSLSAHLIYEHASHAKLNIWIGLIILALIFIKPVFLMLIPVYILFYILAVQKTRTIGVAKAGIVMLVIDFALCVGYGIWFSHNYHVFELTDTAVSNLYESLNEQGLLDLSTVSDSQLRENLSQDNAEYPHYFQSDRTASELRKAVYHSLFQNKAAYTTHALSYIFPWMEPANETTLRRYIWYYTPMWLALLAMTYYTFTCFMVWARARTAPIVSLLIAMVVWSLVLISLFAAPVAASRLLAPTYILFLIAMVQLLTRQISIKKVSRY